MKIRFLQIGFLLSAAYLILVAYSGGPGAAGIDRTGSPLAAGQTCSPCHGSANANTIVTIRMLDGANPIATYIPGQVYTLEVQVSNSGFSQFGSQSVVLTASNANAGTLNNTPTTANTQVSIVNSRSYLEHDGRSSTGIFRTQWTAPTTGTGTVTVYTMGNAVNGAGTGGDQPSSPATLSLTEGVVTTIAYGQSSYCNDGTDPTPNITGVSSGNFSAASGLIINSSSGAIDLSASTPGNYVVTYNYSGGSTTFNVTISARDAATISYGTNPSYCNNAQLAGNIVLTGTSGGTFSSTTGLSIGLTSGTVDPTQSTPGNYTVTYTTTGPCPTTATAPITIVQGDVASFTYGGASFCQSGTDPTPTNGGTQNGNFTASPSGLNINPGTGAIDVSASTIGTYMVSYTTTGTCPASDSISINITAAGSATFNYGAASFCSNENDPVATITGIGGGTFSTTASGLTIINSGTGEIDLSASTAGSYTVYYAVAGACPANDSSVLSILTADQATMSYAQSTYCSSEIDPSATIGGTTGGNFSASPTGLVINTTSGLIDLDASTANTYTISYITSGNCPDTVITSLSVDQCSGINNISQADIRLYPNPTSDGKFFLNNQGDATEIELSIYNNLGQLVNKEIFYLEANTSRQSSLSNDLPKGLYMITLRQGDKVQTFKLVYQ